MVIHIIVAIRTRSSARRHYRYWFLATPVSLPACRCYRSTIAPASAASRRFIASPAPLLDQPLRSPSHLTMPAIGLTCYHRRYPLSALPATRLRRVAASPRLWMGRGFSGTENILRNSKYTSLTPIDVHLRASAEQTASWSGLSCASVSSAWPEFTGRLGRAGRHCNRNGGSSFVISAEFGLSYPAGIVMAFEFDHVFDAIFIMRSEFRRAIRSFSVRQVPAADPSPTRCRNSSRFRVQNYRQAAWQTKSRGVTYCAIRRHIVPR